MKVWKKYNKRQKLDFLKRYNINNWQVLNNILIKRIWELTASEWKILYKAWITNGIGNFLIPFFIRKFLSKILPFLDWRKHDLNCSLWGGLYEYFNAHYWIVKYGAISVLKHFQNGYIMMWLYSLVIWMPVNLILTVVVVLFSWTSFNFVKLEKND
jgi:hypothetical protein